MPLLAALLLCFTGAIVSAFASSTALLGAIIPLAVPFLMQGQISAIGVVAAIAISTTIVDTSPFSTNGALVVANAPEAEREKVLRKLLDLQRSDRNPRPHSGLAGVRCAGRDLRVAITRFDFCAGPPSRNTVKGLEDSTV